MAVITQIQFRRGTAAQWSSTNPVLASGELGYETDTGNFKIGNGSSAWNSLLVLNGITADSTATFTNKTISADNNTISGIAASSFVVTNSSGYIDGSAAQKAIPTGTVVGTSDNQVLTNKTIAGADNTLTVRLANDVTGTLPLGNGGTGATTQAGAANAILPSQGSNAGKYLTTDGSNTSWGTVASYSAPTLGSTTIASGATVTTIAGLTLDGPTLSNTVTASGIINMTATGAVGNVKDFQTLQIMDCI
jgi:hypothetical protein